MGADRPQRRGGGENRKIVKDYVEAKPDVKSVAIWPMLNELQEERNLIGHGVLRMSSDGRPIVVWHKRFLERTGKLGAETFGWDRFNDFLVRGRLLLKTFAQIKDALEAVQQKSS
jgi:hypothetical protein